MKSQEEHPVLLVVTRWSFWFGALLVILGAALAIVGSAGETEFNFFGQSFKSQNVGVASFFLGSAIVVLNVRRILKSLDASKRARTRRG